MDCLTACLNRFQRHKCSGGYCLRTKKGSKEKICRFGFPRSLQETSTVTVEPDRGFWSFAPQRNDSLLNQYNPVLTMAWMANTDVNPITSLQAVIQYVAGYIGKGEKKSSSFRDFLRQVLPKLNSRQPLFSFTSKMLNKLVGERDISAQEVCHILLGESLQEGSRNVITLDCRPEKEQADQIAFQDNDLEEKMTVLDRYKKRNMQDETLRNLTLLEFLRLYDHKKYRPRPKASPRIISYFPYYKSIPASKQYEDYCRVKMMLHHPFLNVQDLAVEIDGKFSFAAAYEICKVSHRHEPDFLHEELDIEDKDETEQRDELESLSDRDETENIQDWELLAARNTYNDAGRFEDPDHLGERDLDRLYDWSTHIGRFPDLSHDYWDTLKASYPDQPVVSVPVEPDRLQPEQRRVYDAVLEQYRRILNGEDPEALRINVDGFAGTGKSYMIAMISASLQQEARAAGKSDPVSRAAPTGIAAFNIQGRTLHSLLRLPVKKKFVPLSSTTLIALQEVFKSCKFLIIDEKSMVGLKTLHWIDQRLREIFPSPRDEWFGGLNLLLCGDFWQLPPVAERGLYFSDYSKLSEEAIQGRRAYEAFTATVILTQIMRQQGEDDESRLFRQALTELRSGAVSEESWQLLLTRTRLSVSPDEARRFEKSLRLFNTNVLVDEYNFGRLRC